MCKTKVWWSAGHWHVCLTLLMWSWVQLLTKSKPAFCLLSTNVHFSGYMVEVCHIPCPLDCKLSDWSAWSACSASCGSGLKIRSKWLREKAFNGGRPCPKLDLKNQVRLAPFVFTYINILYSTRGIHIVAGNSFYIMLVLLLSVRH